MAGWFPDPVLIAWLEGARCFDRRTGKFRPRGPRRIKAYHRAMWQEAWERTRWKGDD